MTTGRTTREDTVKRAIIAELLRQGLRPVVIKERLGCSGDLIASVKRQMAKQEAQ
jgi:hypothetical protein